MFVTRSDQLRNLGLYNSATDSILSVVLQKMILINANKLGKTTIAFNALPNS